MADVTNRAYRILCKRYGADYCITEMVNADAILHADSGALGRAESADEEGPYGIQLFGSNPETMGEAAAILTEKFMPSSIDINFGCPSSAIMSCGAGSALLGSPDKIYSIVESVSEATEIPITAKIRILDNIDDTLEIARKIESSGACALAVHGRTAKMGYSGVANHEFTRRICEEVSIPVIANGDIVDGPKAAEVLEYTGCQALMIGRAAMGDPDIFHRIGSYLENGEIVQAPACEDKLTCLSEYLKLLEEFDLVSHVNLQAHSGWFLKGLKGARKMRSSLQGVRDPEIILENLRRICSEGV
ncbi:nifR3 family TIM-barrel protein [Methanohalophilus levihalophilus]|uniref:tRNA dihydrouridine synthase n=1 Tax=Methanohalophilus levihalophilus TaxID=1431282 RepID=UPI001FDA3B0A|nr:tRNA-dihydrouridine synthase [Methanohalophilus levihalophilus]MBP2030223.1 nifR3 family TIM-barrel protein [Methanohalophilus levihalophilus]